MASPSGGGRTQPRSETSRVAALRRPGNHNRPTTPPRVHPGAPADSPRAAKPPGPSAAARHRVRPLDWGVDASTVGGDAPVAVPRAYSPADAGRGDDTGAWDNHTAWGDGQPHQRQPPPAPAQAVVRPVGSALSSAPTAPAQRPAPPGTGRGAGDHPPLGLAQALSTIERLEMEVAGARSERAVVYQEVHTNQTSSAKASDPAVDASHSALGDAVRTLEVQLAQARRDHEAVWNQMRADKRVFDRMSRELERQVKEGERVRDAALAQAREAAQEAQEAQRRMGALQAELREARADRDRQARAEGHAATRELRAIKEWVRGARARDSAERSIFNDEIGSLEAAAGRLPGEVDGLRARVREMERERSAATAVHATLAAQLEVLQRSEREASARDADHAANTAALRDAARSARADADSARADRSQLLADLDAARGRVQDLEAAADAAAAGEAGAAGPPSVGVAADDGVQLVRVQADLSSAVERARAAEADAEGERARAADRVRKLEVDKEELRARIAAEAARASSAKAHALQVAGDREFCMEAIRQLKQQLAAVAEERDDLLKSHAKGAPAPDRLEAAADDSGADGAPSGGARRGREIGKANGNGYAQASDGRSGRAYPQTSPPQSQARESFVQPRKENTPARWRQPMPEDDDESGATSR